VYVLTLVDENTGATLTWRPTLEQEAQLANLLMHLNAMPVLSEPVQRREAS